MLGFDFEVFKFLEVANYPLHKLLNRSKCHAKVWPEPNFQSTQPDPTIHKQYLSELDLQKSQSIHRTSFGNYRSLTEESIQRTPQGSKWSEILDCLDSWSESLRYQIQERLLHILPLRCRKLDLDFLETKAMNGVLELNKQMQCLY